LVYEFRYPRRPVNAVSFTYYPMDRGHLRNPCFPFNSIPLFQRKNESGVEENK
jgi:hypothetical protein